MKVVDMGNL